MTPTYDHWCVIQSGTAFFGFGKTKRDAIRDAKLWVDDPDDLESELRDFGSSDARVHGVMVLAPCTAKAGEEADSDRGWIETREGVAAKSEEDQ